jgi:hypothetical protein
MSITATASRDARIITAQAQLLDYSGHITRGLPIAERSALLVEIDELRAANGWAPLDMAHRSRRA